jgi:hypothetical protein
LVCACYVVLRPHVTSAMSQALADVYSKLKRESAIFDYDFYYIFYTTNGVFVERHSVVAVERRWWQHCSDTLTRHLKCVRISGGWLHVSTPCNQASCLACRRNLQSGGGGDRHCFYRLRLLSKHRRIFAELHNVLISTTN